MTRSRGLALRELRRRGGEARFGVRLVDLVPGPDHVRAHAVDASGEEWQIRAEYVVGADGANSDVRGHLGITVPDREAIAHLDTAFFRADLGIRGRRAAPGHDRRRSPSTTCAR
ncbi:FAD-dependent monooxygenase [Actinomadura terrae]|uniref:FAD-dependent monooxygenase n=1 Tax=Actinomadura terrae TaxID=604353 RepID=UPI001FA7725D|nr:FAD-dependent monooxygenase [Actinomadura terrae]